MRIVNRSGKSGQAAAKILAARLDGRFTLVNQVRLPGLKRPVDAALVGPPGVIVLAFASDQGRVRCLGDKWYLWNTKVEDFGDAPYNPVKQALDSRAAMQAHVASRQMSNTMPVDCAVLVPDARAQVEYMQPAVSVLSADKMGEFAQALADQRELVDCALANELLKSLGVTPTGKSWQEMSQSVTLAATSRSTLLAGLTRQQVIILAAIAIADFVVLLAGALILLTR
jgi:hypothetical protein